MSDQAKFRDAETYVPAVNLSIIKILIIFTFLSFIIPLSYHGLQISPIYALDFPLFILTIFWMRYISNKNTFSVPNRIAQMVVVLFIFPVWILITSPLSFNISTTITGGLLWFRAVLLFIIMATMYGRAYDIDDIIYLSIILLTIQCSLAVLQGITQQPIGALNQYFGEREVVAARFFIGGEQYLRAQGTLGSPNRVAIWFITVSVFVALSVFRKNSVPNKYVYILLLMTFFALPLTVTRGAIIISFFTIFVLLVSANRKLFIHALPFVSLLIAPILLYSPLQDRLFDSIGSLEYRIGLIVDSLAILLERPLIGTGYGATIEGLQAYGVQTAPPHNLPVLFLVETGVIGFLVIVVFLFLFFNHILISFDIDSSNMAYDMDLVAIFYLVLSLFLLSQLYLTMVNFQVLPLIMAIIGCVVGYADKGSTEADKWHFE